MITTTLNRIRGHDPCKDRWEHLLSELGKTKADDEPLPYADIVKYNGLDDALWCCRAEPKYEKEWRLFAVWCCRKIEHLMKNKCSKNAINVAERYANGQATHKELAVARAASDIAGYTARDAVEYVIREIACTAAEYVAWAAGSAERATAGAVERATAGAAARAAAEAAQKKEFLRVVS